MVYTWFCDKGIYGRQAYMKQLMASFRHLLAVALNRMEAPNQTNERNKATTSWSGCGTEMFRASAIWEPSECWGATDVLAANHPPLWFLESSATEGTSAIRAEFLLGAESFVFSLDHFFLLYGFPLFFFLLAFPPHHSIYLTFPRFGLLGEISPDWQGGPF